MSWLNIITNILLAATVVWFGSNLYYYFWFIYHAPQPLYGYLLFVAVFSVVAMTVWWRGEYLITAGMEQKRYLLLWLLLYAAYGIFAFLHSVQDQIAQQALVDVLKVIVLTGGFSLLLRHPNHLRMSETIFILLVIVASVGNILDFAHPWQLTGVPGRGAGLYINPTIAGSFIVLFMIPAIRPLRPLWRLVLVLTAGVGVSVTFSREAWIMWGVAVIVLAGLGYFSRRYRMVAVLLGVIMGGGLVLALLFGGAAGLVKGAGIDQYLTRNTAQRLGLTNEGQLQDPSAKSRLNLIKRSMQDATNYPFVGNGLGYTARWLFTGGPHDMYLLFFVEGGIVGLLLYLMMFVVLWVSADSIGKLLVATIAEYSLFSHFLLQQPVIMLLMAYIVSSAVLDRVNARGDVMYGSKPHHA
ncbi:MAG TPA: O-antigen ligase family protein [Nitrococcus sp.]|nr:O-antigen ligase family protein [Nitrococcus sp.]